MGKKYDCHKQKYYVPQNKPSWAILNLKQASKKIAKERSVATKQTLRCGRLAELHTVVYSPSPRTRRAKAFLKL